jgi:ribonuclease HI
MQIRIYAKAGVCLHAKFGAYSFIMDDLSRHRTGAQRFKKPIRTLTQADCMAYVNALHILSQTAAAEEVQTLEIYTDSGKVIDLLEIYKAEKHCEEVARWWREQVRPHFKNLKQLKFQKIGSKPLAGNAHSFKLSQCEAKANGILKEMKELIK